MTETNQSKKKTTPGAALAAMRKTEEKTCANPTCGKTFVGLKKKRFCNDTCKQSLRAQVQKEARRIKKAQKQQ
jgi:hypothetical protein